MKKLILVGVLATYLGGNIFGMNVHNSINDDFGRRMTESLANLNTQSIQNENALRSQFIAIFQVLLNRLDEKDAQIRSLQDQITQLQNLNGTLEQGNVLAREANEQKKKEIQVAEERKRIAKERKRIEEERAAQEAQAIQARNAERARLQGLIDKKNHRIDDLDKIYIHPHKPKVFSGTCNGMGADFQAFCRGKSNAEREIPKLKAEVASLERQRDSL